MEDYIKQANDFLEKTKTGLKISIVHTGNFFGENDIRDIYSCTLTRGLKSYTFNFGQSMAYSIHYQDKCTKEIYMCDGTRVDHKKKRTRNFLISCCYELRDRRKAPTSYDILSCLEKYDPESFNDFCDNYGYDNDSISAHKIYESVKDQYQNLCVLFNDEEMDMLAEIQ
jgi:hypothetical protein